MTMQEIKAVLDRTGLPVAYRSFPVGSAPDLPFLCYMKAHTRNFAADGIVYATVDHINIELYTKWKDPETEGKVEQVLTDAELYWEKSEIYLEDEKCYQMIYEIEV